VTAEYKANGLYDVQYVPQKAGTYVVRIMNNGSPISGSPWIMICSAGEVAPGESSHSIDPAASVEITAGITYFFYLTLRDIFSNVIRNERGNTSVSIQATYLDHDSWLSPLTASSDTADVLPDLKHWEQIYGKDVEGLAIFRNVTISEPDATYVGQFTIYRAGKFTLDVEVNNLPVRSSPLPLPVLVSPAELYAPACIVDGLTLEMVADSTYSANIQTRDFYSNNMKEDLATSVRSWRAQLVQKSRVDGTDIVVKEGTIIDTPGAPGVFTYSFSPTLAGTDFRIRLQLNGLDVDATSRYRTDPLVVKPAPTTSALTTNYSILAEPSQSVIQYVDQEATRSYVYEAGVFFKILIDARDRFGNLRYDSTTDVFTVTLTGEDGSTVLSGDATALSNGSYYYQHQVTIEQPYDLKVQMPGDAHILDSPMNDRIRVNGTLVQAAYTRLTAAIPTLTAGVPYTTQIQTKDIFGNVILGSKDHVGFQVRSNDASITKVLVHDAQVEYLFELYAATFTLFSQGAYSGIITVTQRNGLLATYYNTVDFSSPVLLESLHGHSAAPGTDPFSVSATTGDWTHFTRLDPQIDIDIGTASALADLIPSPVPSFPTMFFSAVWRGFLRAPESALYRIHLDSFQANFHELTIGNETRVQSWFSPEQELGSEPVQSIYNENYTDIWLEKDILTHITVKYAKKLGPTKIRLLWESDTLAKTVIDRQYLLHTLGSQTTPVPITVIPALTNASFCHLTNDLDYRYAVVNVQEVHTVNLRDEFGNLQNH
jgi:archaellum component FlaF (FlaF/FlaG flagellin family)